MEEQLQLEETQRTNQQTQDQIPYDPSAASKNPEGYTSVPDVVSQTQVEEVDPINVGQVEVTTPQQEGANSNEVFGGSGDIPVTSNSEINNPQVLNSIPFSQVNNDFLGTLPDSNITTIGDISGGDNTVGEVLNPPVDLPVNPPMDPEDPEDPDPEDPDPKDPEDPDPEDPEDPDPEDPEDPDPEDPDPEDPEDPEDPDPEDPDPEDPDPEDPEDPDPEDPEDPDPEDPGKGNPGNDKEVGNSPWDGETGASDNPGKGNHQDGLDPETNQPPGDSKNDGSGQGNNSENDNGNGGGGGTDLQRGENNGFGNGDQDAPGNSLNHNNAENDQNLLGDYVDRFVSEHPGDYWYDDVHLDNNDVHLSNETPEIFEQIHIINENHDVNYDFDAPDHYYFSE